jgi:hypothetical protein
MGHTAATALGAREMSRRRPGARSPRRAATRRPPLLFHAWWACSSGYEEGRPAVGSSSGQEEAGGAGQEREKMGRNEGEERLRVGVWGAPGPATVVCGMDSPRPRCEARFQLLTRAWLDRFRRKWAWLNGHMQANKHPKVGWTQNL